MYLTHIVRSTALTFAALTLLLYQPIFAQELDYTELRQLVQAFKQDPRGPFQAIRWFCPDGTVLPPKERCAQPGGIQHALHKDVVQKLADDYHIFLGQILAGTPFDEFQDVANNYSRLKQYQIEKYLQAADDGWIMRLARYYRGAYQAEDEAAWSDAFLRYLLEQESVIRSHFFLARQITIDLPHGGNTDRATEIRALAKTIADSLPQFMDIRVKIHGRPDETDLTAVRSFHQEYALKISTGMQSKLFRLEQALEVFYAQATIEALRDYRTRLPDTHPVLAILARLNHDANGSNSNMAAADSTTRHALISRVETLVDLLYTTRISMLKPISNKNRLALMELSRLAETILFKQVEHWRPALRREILQKAYLLAKALAGCGFIEIWEWQRLDGQLRPAMQTDSLSLGNFLAHVQAINRSVEWASRMVRAVYGIEVDRFAKFEPLAHGFFDDRVRGSILLRYGEVASELTRLADRHSGLYINLLGLPGDGQVRGLNPGIAKGELRIITGAATDVEFAQDKIYVLEHPPADLKPVAGILSISEGNAVSHVQLLARNLGIPNAAISTQVLKRLTRYDGSMVFFAVSHRGSVVMKHAKDMAPDEHALVAETRRLQRRLTVPIDQIDLERTGILSLRNLRADDSGRICGPKAANLGQLKAMFPGKVVPGLVMPFGLFRAHMEQLIPGTDRSYWQFLEDTFTHAETLRRQGKTEMEIERQVLFRLEKLRDAIYAMSFLPGFVDTLRSRFRTEFGAGFGELAIFIRSDTNMEDLKDFTGAGLNLTVFNIRDEATILQSIRRVWASPFTERSFRWRQRYLSNPENVYPSLLLLPSVNVEKSGVMITSGVVSSNADDILAAMNWGGGGAVEGQAAETYLLRADGENVLLYPAREPLYNFLPETGGVAKKYVQFYEPILSPSDLEQLRAFSDEVDRVLPATPGIETDGPFDIELGFWNDSIYLFQVRPFVENKLARSSQYLNQLDPELDEAKLIELDQTLDY